MLYVEDTQLCVQVGSLSPLPQSLLALAGKQKLQQQLAPHPPASAILQALNDAYAQGYEKTASNEFELKGIALAGAGDPLLHLDVIAAFLPAFKQLRHGVPVSLVTYGLVPYADAAAVCQQLEHLEVERLLVFLPASNPMAYAALTGATAAQFSDLCHFIQSASETSLDVRTFAFSPCSQRSELRALSQSLGAREFILKSTGE